MNNRFSEDKKNEKRVLMERSKSNIYKQAGMACLAIVVTVVLCFAMTVAWYSNIVHTGDMKFQASSWDFQFEGLVTLGAADSAIAAAPGDTGVLEFSLENTTKSTDTGDVNTVPETIGVLVNVSKETFQNEEMEKRIYFYVDVPQTVNEETVSRVYLSEDNGYLYRVLAGNTLVISEDFSNDEPIYWEWVYDVLGYYVSGSLDANGVLQIEEYLRPVTYNYDSATYDTAGNLAMIDEETTAAEFLQELYNTDGYEGNTVPSVTGPEGYYPVEVEDNGTGVWLYLCNKSEIQAANDFDTRLAQQSEDQKTEFAARVMLSGQKQQEVTVNATSQENLIESLVPGNDRVVLNGDITLNEGRTLTLNEGTDVILDLNGHTLYAPATNSIIYANEGSGLTIVNGNIELTGTAADTSTAIQAVGAQVTMQNIKITGGDYTLYVDDKSSAGDDSYIRITNCTFESDDMSIMVKGNGNTSASRTKMIIENSKINSKGYVGLMGSGSAAGTDIEIVGSTITGYWAGIYHPQDDSVMKVTNSTITGYTGMAVKGGEVIITNCTVQGTGTQAVPEFSGSGFSDTGDGIYIEDNYNWKISVFVQGENTNVLSDYGYAIQKYSGENKLAAVVVNRGKFSTDVSGFLPADGSCVCTQLADGKFEVGLAPAVAGE